MTNSHTPSWQRKQIDRFSDFIVDAHGGKSLSRDGLHLLQRRFGTPHDLTALPAYNELRAAAEVIHVKLDNVMKTFWQNDALMDRLMQDETLHSVGERERIFEAFHGESQNFNLPFDLPYPAITRLIELQREEAKIFTHKYKHIIERNRALEHMPVGRIEEIDQQLDATAEGFSKIHTTVAGLITRYDKQLPYDVKIDLQDAAILAEDAAHLARNIEPASEKSSWER